jgi:Ubiquitin 3 binding protein But2 C-terminal domain
MKLTSIAAITALLGASLGSGAALFRRAPPSFSGSTSTVLYPYATSQYTVSTGAINYGTTTGQIYKATNDDGKDITTLLTFVIPSSWAGETCELGFTLASADTSTGSQEADVFTSIAPATASTSSWPPGNLRDDDYARFHVTAPGTATLVQAFGPLHFPCPGGETFGLELVGVGDNDNISWSVTSGSGPTIQVV